MWEMMPGEERQKEEKNAIEGMKKNQRRLLDYGTTFQKMVSTEALPILDVLHHVVSKLVHVPRGPVQETTILKKCLLSE